MHTLLEGGTFFEGARWHDGAWWVADIYAHRVLRVTPHGEAATAAEVPQQPSGLGWLPDGRLLVVSMKDRRLLRQEANGHLVEHADLTAVTAGWANDMVVDGQGRAYVGNLGFDLFGTDTPAHTTLALVTPDGDARVVADDLRFPNGTVITADGRTLIVAESFGGALTAFTIAPDGTLSDRRLFAQLGRAPKWDSLETMVDTDCVPDGCAIDAEDHVWVADAIGGRALRVSPRGIVVQTVHAPDGLGVYACALGGVNGRSLLLCAAPDFHADKRSVAREAILFTVDVDVTRGHGLP